MAKYLYVTSLAKPAIHFDRWGVMNNADDERKEEWELAFTRTFARRRGLPTAQASYESMTASSNYDGESS